MEKQQELDKNLTLRKKANIFQLFGYVLNKYWKQTNIFYIS